MTHCLHNSSNIGLFMHELVVVSYCRSVRLEMFLIIHPTSIGRVHWKSWDVLNSTSFNSETYCDYIALLYDNSYK